MAVCCADLDKTDFDHQTNVLFMFTDKSAFIALSFRQTREKGRGEGERLHLADT